MSNNMNTSERARLTCCDVGLDRTKKWPRYFFCSLCTLYENEIAIHNERATRRVKKCQWAARHVCFSAPTTKISKWCRDSIRNNEQIDTNDWSETNNATIIENEENNTTVQMPMTNPLKKHNVKKCVDEKNNLIKKL